MSRGTHALLDDALNYNVEVSPRAERQEVVHQGRLFLKGYAPSPGESTAPAGGLRDPSNTQADLRVVFATAGYGWVTSHVYRKTVATLMDQSGLSARQAADQLGHAKVSMTQDNYFGRKIGNTGAAAVLEAFGDEKQSRPKPGVNKGSILRRPRGQAPGLG